MSGGQGARLDPSGPLALVIDDDPDFCAYITRVLEDLGLRAETFARAEDFLVRLKQSSPAVCIIDVNLDRPRLGYQIVRAVRAVRGGALPLFIASGESDSASIAHALELGANDYVVKPIDRKLLASKLLNYLTSEKLRESSSKLQKVSDEGLDARLTADMEISGVDELGLRLVTRHLIAKGTPITVQSSVLAEITGHELAILATVVSTWVETEGQVYGAYAEFDADNAPVLGAVRKWLSGRPRAAEPFGGDAKK